jgi:hypothetical protein
MRVAEFLSRMQSPGEPGGAEASGETSGQGTG